MCRKIADIRGKPCQLTDLREVRMSFGDLGDLYTSEGWGRRISQAEALELAQRSEEESLVLISENAQDPQFMCACYGD